MQPTLPSWSHRALWRLVWPMMVELLLNVLIGMADTVMVTSAGEAAVSGISLVDAINMLLITVFTSMATGGAVIVSQYLGRRDGANASRASAQLLSVNLALSAFLMVVALVFNRAILSLIYGHIEPAVMQNAQIYFTLTAISYPFFGLYNAGASIFRSMGNSKVGMAISVVVNLVNIGGNALLIYGLGWGVAGAGAASLASRVVAAGAILLLLRRLKHGPIQIKGLAAFKPDLSIIRRILRVGLPSGVENSIFQVGKLLVARIVSTFGTAAIAANAIAGTLTSFGFVFGQAIGLGLLTVVGQCCGAGHHAGARQYHKKLVGLCHLIMAGVSLVFFLFGSRVLGLFNLSDTARQIAWQCCAINFAAIPFIWPESFAIPNSLRAAGDVRYTMVVSLSSMWLFRIGFSFLFAYGFGWGVQGVYLAMLVDWLVRAILFTTRWLSARWQRFDVLKN